MITPGITYFNRNNFRLRYSNFVKESDLYLKNESNVSIIENNQTIIGFYVRYYRCGNYIFVYNYNNIMKFKI